MSEGLRDLMERTAREVEGGFVPPDLGRIMRDGDRVRGRRRRRTAGVLAVAAAVATVGGVALVGTGRPGGGADVARRPDSAAGPVSSDGTSWAVGSQVITPSGVVDIGHPVRAYVRTGIGYVAIDDRGDIRSIVDGRVSELGHSDYPQPILVSDPEDTLVAWLVRDGDGEGWAWSVHDQAADGAEVLVAPFGRTMDEYDDQAVLDARQLYVRATPVGGGDQPGHYRVYDVDTGESWETALSRPGAVLMDAAAVGGDGEVLAWYAGDRMVVQRMAEAPVDLAGARQGDVGVLSPDGRWLSADGDRPAVYDTRTGQRQSLDVGGRAFATGYEWLDDDRLAVLAGSTEKGPAELLACSVASGRCDEMVRFGSFDDLIAGGFSLPVGIALED